MRPTNKHICSRRTLLRGFGGACIGLPFLESVLPRSIARAATDAPRRFLTWFTPGGTVMENWKPQGSQASYTLGAILAALEPLKHLLVIPQGLGMHVTYISQGDIAHGSGNQALLTGYNEEGYGLALGPSIDQVLAPLIGGDRRFLSLELGITSGRDKSVPQKNMINISSPGKGIPPELDPQRAFTRLFSDALTAPDTAAKLRARNQSILDGVGKQYATWIGRLSGEDRIKLEQHLDKVRELEQSLNAPVAGAPGALACQAPTIGETSDFERDENIPRTGQQMTDLMVMALACDLTRVGTLQWNDANGDNSLPWLGLPQSHHHYQHINVYDPEALTKIYTWYTERFEYLLRSLMAVKEEDGRSLLDNCLVFAGSELSHPGEHSRNDMPFILAGSAGGALQTGRWLEYDDVHHNDLLVSILNIFGSDAQKFGHPDWCNGPLSGLA